MTNKNELASIKRDVEFAAKLAFNLEIKNADNMKEAVARLSGLNQYADSVKEKKEALTKPANEILRNIRTMFKPIEDVYTGAIEALRSKMTIYQTVQVKARQKAELAIASRIKEGKGNLSIETAIKKLEKLDVVNKEVATTEGLVQFREKKMLKILDATLIPREYLVVDEVKLLKDLVAGKQVPGAEVETIQTPCNYR